MTSENLKNLSSPETGLNAFSGQKTRVTFWVTKLGGKKLGFRARAQNIQKNVKTGRKNRPERGGGGNLPTACHGRPRPSHGRPQNCPTAAHGRSTAAHGPPTPTTRTTHPENSPKRKKKKNKKISQTPAKPGFVKLKNRKRSCFSFGRPGLENPTGGQSAEAHDHANWACSVYKPCLPFSLTS